VQNKIGQFLSASVIRNIVAQVRSRINIREIMDTQKIFIMNLSKGRIGEDNSRLLGGMLITKIQLAAMERVDTVEKDRKDFFLYVDEFQNFATESFSNILSEARKYRLDLVMAHQYMEQLDETVLAAVIGNVGTLVTFRVGSTDAEILAKEFAPTFLETDLVNLTKFQIYLKLMIDGVASQPFSANTLSPINLSTHSSEKVIRVSRERYATNRENIEDKIMRWTGIDSKGEDADADDGADVSMSEKKDSDDEYTEDEEGMPVKIIPPVKTPAPERPVQKPSEPKNTDVKQKRHEEKKHNTHGNNFPKQQHQKQHNDKHKKVLDVKQSTPVLLVDSTQKGMSLSQAMQTNKQQHHKNEPVAPANLSSVPVSKETAQLIEQISSSTATSVVAEPVKQSPVEPEDVSTSMSVPPQPESLQKPSTGGRILPNSIVKID
jgi:hypothetical protein